jgi:hypothetical protein
LTDLPESIRDDLPEPVEGLLTWISKKGFLLIEQSYSQEHFGNYSSVWARWPSAFRIVRDRSIWGIRLAEPWTDLPPKSNNESLWSWQAIWQAYLQGLSVPENPSEVVPLNEQIQFFKDQFDELEILLTSTPQLSDNLMKIKKATFKTNFPQS